MTSPYTPEELDDTQPVIIRPPWLVYAQGKIGTREIRGDEDNQFIVDCLRMAGLPASMLHDETAWCGAFAGRCMRESNIKPPKGYAKALNWANWGVELETPVEGCVAVFKRPPNPEHGHVAFVVGVGPANKLQMLGGNQNNAVMIKGYDRDQLLSLRWPTAFDLPTHVITQIV